MELVKAQWGKGKFVCVGLDSDYSKIPESVRRADVEATMFQFNRAIIEATHDVVGFYKPNIAFYEAQFIDGLRALKSTIDFIHSIAPSVPVILDFKRGDIDNTNNGYVQLAFDWLNADAVTVHPYLGAEAMQPFLGRSEKGIIVLCRTSNKGADEFQDQRLPFGKLGTPLYQYVAHQVESKWNQNGNCGVVVGATYPNELQHVRQIVGHDMPILIPGIGAQGGDLEKTVAAGKNSRGQGMIINSSRGIIFASKEEDFANAARRETQKLHDAITKCLSTPTHA